LHIAVLSAKRHFDGHHYGEVTRAKTQTSARFVLSELAAFIAPVTVEAGALLKKEGHGLGVLKQRF
jgi:hypothetical protein